MKNRNKPTLLTFKLFNICPRTFRIALINNITLIYNVSNVYSYIIILLVTYKVIKVLYLL